MTLAISAFGPVDKDSIDHRDSDRTSRMCLPRPGEAEGQYVHGVFAEVARAEIADLPLYKCEGVLK